MRLSNYFNSGNREIRFFGVFRESPPLHFYLMQFIGFFYVLYRFASRNYTVYGFLTNEHFDYPRTFIIELWPIPLLHFTSFQFIYAFIPRPTPEVIYGLQWIIVGYGGTTALCLLLVLALSPAESFYGVKNGFSLSKRGVAYHWPVFLLLLLIGSFYTEAGLNKIIDIGPHWPFVLHLENLAATGIEASLFLTSRFVNPVVSSFHLSSTLSVIAGVITLIGELFFISVLFLPRYRPFFIVSMVALHLLVFTMGGINFVGNSFILLLCLDWNALVRRVEVYHDNQCNFCLRSLAWAKRFDWFNRIQLIPLSRLTPGEINTLPQKMRLKDENGEIYDGVDVLEQLSARCPVLWPVAAFMKIPGVIYLARYIYTVRLGNRVKLAYSDNNEIQSSPSPGSNR